MIVKLMGSQTLDDLERFPGKAELIAGRVVEMTRSGSKPGWIAFLITQSLAAHAKATGAGQAVPEGTSFAPPDMPPTGRQSFAPDAAYYAGPRHYSEDMILAAPAFAAEVRSKNDRGPAADAEYALKRTEYFAAGTLVVWDFDIWADTVACYASADPESPRVFGRGDVADAEPAVPGWRVAIDDLLAPP